MASPLDIIFPPRCAFCRMRSGTSICDGCQRSLPWVTEQREDCLAPLLYRDKVRETLHRYKFQGYSGYARVLGELMLMCLKDSGVPRPDAVCWVPSSGLTVYKRGYNQSRRLAAVVAGGLDAPLRRLLVKTVRNKSQTKAKSAAERAENVRGAFAARADANGLTILLVDDIYTTGATMRECAGALRAAGAERVICVCAARKA